MVSSEQQAGITLKPIFISFPLSIEPSVTFQWVQFLTQVSWIQISRFVYSKSNHSVWLLFLVIWSSLLPVSWKSLNKLKKVTDSGTTYWNLFTHLHLEIKSHAEALLKGMGFLNEMPDSWTISPLHWLWSSLHMRKQKFSILIKGVWRCCLLNFFQLMSRHQPFPNKVMPRGTNLIRIPSITLVLSIIPVALTLNRFLVIKPTYGKHAQIGIKWYLIFSHLSRSENIRVSA